MFEMEVPKNFPAVYDVVKFPGWVSPKRLANPTNGGSGLLSIIALIPPPPLLRRGVLRSTSQTIFGG